jgi:hypothetical protein
MVLGEFSNPNLTVMTGMTVMTVKGTTEHVLTLCSDIRTTCVTTCRVEALIITLLFYSYPLLEYVMQCSEVESTIISNHPTCAHSSIMHAKSSLNADEHHDIVQNAFCNVTRHQQEVSQ